MPASRYSVCPYCFAKENAQTLIDKENLEQSYGIMPVEDFIYRMSLLEKKLELDEEDLEPTVREDWEVLEPEFDEASKKVYVTFVYSFYCEVCKTSNESRIKILFPTAEVSKTP